MKENKKLIGQIIGAVFALLVIAVVVFGIVFGGFIPVSKDEVVSSFEENKAVMQAIAETLSDYEKSTLVLSYKSDMWEMYEEFFAESEKDNTVSHSPYLNMCASIHELFEDEGYKVIIKNKNYILFSKQESYDYSSGVVFSFDGKAPRVDGATEVHVLEQENWYYYESEYDMADNWYSLNDMKEE